MEIKERENNLGQLTCAAHLAAQVASPAPPRPCHLPRLPGGQTGAWRAPTLPRPPPASPAPPSNAMTMPRVPSLFSLTRCILSPPLALSLELIRVQPSPLTSARAATAIPKPLRHALELRRSYLVLFVVSCDQKSPWMPLASPFPSSATEDRHRQIRRRSAFPEPAVHLYGIHVSSSVVSPPPLPRFPPLTPTTVRAESSPPPAMSPP